MIEKAVEELITVGIKISTAEEDKIAYCKDFNPLHLHKLLKRETPALPDAVAFPKSTEEVSIVLRTANAYGIPVYIFGGASGVIDAATPYEGGIALSTLLLKDIEINAENMMVKAGAGVVGGRLEKILNHRGFTLRHSPQSLYCSTVGGWVATAASGQFSTGYGNIEDLIVSLTAVLPDGEIVTERVTPRRAGPDLKKLFVGSEGLLGVVTEVIMKIFELPEESLTLSVEYNTMGEAVKDAKALMSLKPALMRIFDDEESLRYFDTEKFSLIAVFEGKGAGTKADMAKKIVRGNITEGYAEKWLDKRFNVSDISRIVPLGFIFDTIEVACFWSDAEKLYHEVIKAIRSVEGTITASAHASHFYESGLCFYFTFAGFPVNIEEYYREVWRRAIETSLKNGGNITHHHGIGRLRKGWLSSEIGGYITILRDLKSVLDRRNILNRGVMFD
ncbi:MULTISPECIES: FAD-binding oxidoreductase [unclassified Archaeoglobus]|mgnify:CR=1 FL=1|jgi:alkyldihydroxyacetonephosphate synthase|uniref:FAD-binding oxidoreductase n=1 Tax=unclassified Archaeoglobus TaxID=2643606 RepID=UPI0025BD8385|nr:MULTISPECIES: FAD-binding oxidoreductase [unclassified Archaeoglobus]